MRVFIIAALTADGFIAQHANQLADWTGPADKKLFVQLTKEAGVIVMGATTFNTLGRGLPGRRTIVYSREPIDSEGVETTTEDPTELLRRLEAEGHNTLAVCGGQTIYDTFVRAGVVSELYITIVSKLFGQGVNLFSGTLEASLELVETRVLDKDSVLLHYTIRTAETGQHGLV